MQPYETREQDGFTLKLYVDDMAENPFEMFDQATTLALDSRDYDFGSNHMGVREATGHDWEDFFASYYTGVEYKHGGWDLLKRYMRMRDGVVAMVPIHLADYGSGEMSCFITSEPDSYESLEFAFITREDFDKMVGSSNAYPNDQQHARMILEAEVKEFNSYLEGDVWGYAIEDECGEILDSCWGFYGYQYFEEEAETAFAYTIKAEKRKRWEQVEIDNPPTLRGW